VELVAKRERSDTGLGITATHGRGPLWRNPLRSLSNAVLVAGEPKQQGRQ
jgi:hypothetical protein